MYSKFRHSVFALVALSAIALAACSKKEAPATVQTAPTVRVTGAVDAINRTISVATESAFPVRPAALLSIYVNMALADGSVFPVTAALEGVDAQLQLHAQPTESQIDSLYELLDEFGAVLVVDLPDMLNRSPERAQALDAYVRGLTNVTERARRRSATMESDIATLKQKVKEQKAIVKTLDKEIKEAAKVNDFSTVGAKRQELATEQSTLTGLEAQLDEASDLEDQFASLIALSDERLAAIDQNREALIAGIRVTDMPGIDELGVIQGKSKRGRTTGGGGGLRPFGGL